MIQALVSLIRLFSRLLRLAIRCIYRGILLIFRYSLALINFQFRSPPCLAMLLELVGFLLYWDQFFKKFHEKCLIAY